MKKMHLRRPHVPGAIRAPLEPILEGLGAIPPAPCDEERRQALKLVGAAVAGAVAAEIATPHPPADSDAAALAKILADERKARERLERLEAADAARIERVRKALERVPRTQNEGSPQ